MATSRSGSVLFNARTAHGTIKPTDRNFIPPYRVGKTKRDKRGKARRGNGSNGSNG